MNFITKILQWFQSGEIFRHIPDLCDLHLKDLFAETYTKKYDYRILAPYFIENQYGLQVCSFEAWANALAIYFGEPVSARWLVAKAWQKRYCRKGGRSVLKSGARVAHKFGVVFEKDLPSDETMSWDDFVNIDFTKYDALASQRKIGSYYFVDDIGDYLQAIDEGYAVVLGRDWSVSIPFGPPWIIDRSSNSRGGHSTVGIGYKGQLLVGANSWGVQWGDKGLYYADLKDIQKDIDYYGAIAITPIKYMPKDIKVKTLLGQLNTLKDKLATMLNAENLLYGTAKGLLGRNLSPRWQPLACVASMSYICNKAFQDNVSWINTTQFYNWMKASDKWEEIDKPQPKCVIVSVTGLIPRGSPLKHGHLGIVGQYTAPDGSLWVMSNNSDKRMWDTYFTLKKWDDYYVKKGQIPTFYFRRTMV